MPPYRCADCHEQGADIETDGGIVLCGRCGRTDVKTPLVHHDLPCLTCGEVRLTMTSPRTGLPECEPCFASNRRFKAKCPCCRETTIMNREWTSCQTCQWKELAL